MITKKSDYAQTTAFGQSDYKALPADGYICRILKAEETADKGGNPMIHIAFDIVEGEYTGYFMNLYQSRKKSSDKPLEVKYPFEGQAWIGVNDYLDPSKTSRKFKGLCTALEDSGTEVWSPKGDFMLMNLANAEVGVVYQRVEDEYQGKTRWKTVPWGFRSVKSIEDGDFFVPDDKPYEKKESAADSFASLEEDLPF